MSLAVSSLVAKEPYPGATDSIAGRACVGCSGGSVTGSHGCVSPESPLLSPGSPVLLQQVNTFMTALPPQAAVNSSGLKVLRPDLTLPQ